MILACNRWHTHSDEIAENLLKGLLTETRAESRELERGWWSNKVLANVGSHTHSLVWMDKWRIQCYGILGRTGDQQEGPFYGNCGWGPQVKQMRQRGRCRANTLTFLNFHCLFFSCLPVSEPYLLTNPFSNFSSVTEGAREWGTLAKQTIEVSLQGAEKGGEWIRWVGRRVTSTERYLHSCCMRAGTRSNVFLAVSPTSEIMLGIVGTQHMSVEWVNVLSNWTCDLSNKMLYLEFRNYGRVLNIRHSLWPLGVWLLACD